MKSKLISFALILLLSMPLAIGQSSDKGTTSFAVLAGINFQNLNGKDMSGSKLTNDILLGYHIGVNAQIPIAPEFYFQPGLLFTTKGAKYTTSSSAKLSYVELPLNIVYKALVGNGNFMLGFGPYLGYAIKSSGGDFKAFDAGGNIFAGYVLASGLFLQLDTQFGMLDINDGNPLYKSVRNTGFGLSLGYQF
jgi:hypothetical protein